MLFHSTLKTEKWENTLYCIPVFQSTLITFSATLKMAIFALLSISDFFVFIPSITRPLIDLLKTEQQLRTKILAYSPP